MMYAVARPKSIQATLRLRNAVPKQLMMAGSMSGSIPVVSTSQAAPNSRRLSTLCTSSISSHGSAMRTYRTCGLQQRMWNTGAMIPNSGVVSGLPEVGNYRNYLLQNELYSLTKIGLK